MSIELANEIRERYKEETAADCLREVERALETEPNSASLLCLFGDLIQLADVDGYELQDCRAAYERALAADPRSAEANESLGYFFDVLDEDLPKAEHYFRRALVFESREDSYTGLARVLAESGQRTEALTVLDSSKVQSDSVQFLRGEIKSGMWDPS